MQVYMLFSPVKQQQNKQKRFKSIHLLVASSVTVQLNK